MPTWSRHANDEMAALINRDGESADAVASLRNLVNQWADNTLGPGGSGTRSFIPELPGQAGGPYAVPGLRYAVTVNVQNGEVMHVLRG